MHFAIHGKTAAEMINERVDAKKPFLGLTNFKGNYITTRDVEIAKNFLSEAELKQLNLIVSMYLDFAELQASSGRLMKMQDWIQKLDDFLKVSGKELLKNAGKGIIKPLSGKPKLNMKSIENRKIKNMFPILIER
jgi:hypothetical protein